MKGTTDFNGSTCSLLQFVRVWATNTVFPVNSCAEAAQIGTDRQLKLSRPLTARPYQTADVGWDPPNLSNKKTLWQR